MVPGSAWSVWFKDVATRNRRVNGGSERETSTTEIGVLDLVSTDVGNLKMTDSKQGGPPGQDDPDRTSKRVVRPKVKARSIPGASDLLQNIPGVGLDSPGSDTETREVAVDPSLMQRCAAEMEDVTEEIVIDPELIQACRPDDPDGDPPDAPIPDIVRERLEAARTGQYVKIDPGQSAPAGPVPGVSPRAPASVPPVPSESRPADRRGDSNSGVRLVVVVLVGILMLILGLIFGGVTLFVILTSGSEAPVTVSEPTAESLPLPVDTNRSTSAPEPEQPIVHHPEPAQPSPSPTAPIALVPAPMPAGPEPTPEETVEEPESPDEEPREAPPAPESSPTPPAAELAELPERLLVPVTFAPGSASPEEVDTAGIRRIAVLVTQERGVRMELIGFCTDPDGLSGAEAAALGRSRAESVRDLLRAQGPSRRRFSARGARDDESLGGSGGASTNGNRRLVILRPNR